MKTFERLAFSSFILTKAPGPGIIEWSLDSLLRMSLSLIISVWLMISWKIGFSLRNSSINSSGVLGWPGAFVSLMMGFLGLILTGLNNLSTLSSGLTLIIGACPPTLSTLFSFFFIFPVVHLLNVSIKSQIGRDCDLSLLGLKILSRHPRLKY